MLLLAELMLLTAIASGDVVPVDDTLRADTKVVLAPRVGTPPKSNDGVPHVQLDQLSPRAIIEELLAWIPVGLPNASTGRSHHSLPSSVGFHVRRGGGKTEFGHMHKEGHFHLPFAGRLQKRIVEAGWGIPHPVARQFTMVFAPRDATDLVEIKKILRLAHARALQR